MMEKKTVGGDILTQQAHPFWRGAALAAVFALIMVLTGTPVLSPAYRLWDASRPALAFGGMAVIGAFLASIPGRIRRKKEARPKLSVSRCVVAFASGIGLMLGLALAGSGDIRLICGVMQGGLGALAFAACAWLTGLITARLMGRWRA